LRALQGNDQLSIIGNFKAVMFHEMIQAPLNTLYVIWTILNKFVEQAKMLDIDSMEKGIDSALSAKKSKYNEFEAAIKAQRPGSEQYMFKGYEPDIIVNDKKVFHSYTKATNPDIKNILVYRGMYGMEPCEYSGKFAHHLTWDLMSHVASKYDASLDKANIAEGVKRFVIDRDEILEDLLNLMFSLSSNFNDLVTVKAQGTNLIVDFSNLADLSSNILVQVRKNIEKFRGQIDDSILKRAEGGSSSSDNGGVSRTVGSLSWLEEQLMERLFKGSRDAAAPGIKGLNISLPQISEMLDATYKNLAKKWTILARIKADKFDKPDERSKDSKLDQALYQHELTLLENSYDNPISELLYWSPHTKVTGDGTDAKSVEIPGELEMPITGKRSDVKNNHVLLGRANITNTQNAWPFYAIPSIDILNNTDDEIKVYKELNTRLEGFKEQYKAKAIILYGLRADAGNNSIGVNNFADFKLDKDPNDPNSDSTFVFDESEANVQYKNISIYNSKFPLDKILTSKSWQDVKGVAALKPHVEALEQIMKTYNTDFERRNELMKISLKIPITGRQEWYEDPANTSYLLGTEKDDTREEEFGLLVRLNQILSRYLYMSWDPTAKKMYRNLIDKFANGTHSDAVINGNAINDIALVNAKEEPKNIGVPKSHTVLFASLARFMRNVLMATKRGSNDPSYRTDLLTEVPIYMKENYRSGLVAFDKLFKLVIKKAEMIKSLTGHFSVVRQIAFLDSYGIDNEIQDNTVNLDMTVTVGGNWKEYAKMYPAALNMFISADDCVHRPTGVFFRNISSSATDSRGWIRGINNKSVYATYMSSKCDNTSESNTSVKFSPHVFLNKENARQWMNSLSDDIINAASSISKCSLDTYRELTDEPKFFETHEGFILDYNNNHRMEPLMLLSQAQLILRNRYSHNSNDDPNGVESEWDEDTQSGYARQNYMLPFHKNGTPSHKLLYGTRLILNRPDIVPTLEFMPGMQTLLDKYNGSCTPDARMDKSEFEKFNISHNELLRYIADLKFYKPLLDTTDGGFNSTKMSTSLFDVPLSNKEVKLPKEQRDYAMKHTLDEIIDITESSDQEESIRELIGSMSSKSVSALDNRQQARIYNIIDLNVVPVNVHALMRDIPLANILNYSYTADRMIQDALMPNGFENEFKLIDTTQPSKNTNHLMCKMLLNPYAHLTDTEYYGLFARIVTGDSGLGLERPKFISDQIWNKVLFADQYTMGHDPRGSKLGRPDEAGPRSDNAQRRYVQENSGNIVPATNVNASYTNVSGPYASADMQYATYNDETHEEEIKQIKIGSTEHDDLLKYGKLRFDTKFVRDHIFIIQLQRLMRLVMRNEIDELGSPIGHDLSILNRQITEYISNEKFDGSIFRTPNVKE
jgi:hypothetical protein